MRKVIEAGLYTFDASAGTITYNVTDWMPEFMLGIWNLTDGVKLYDPHVPGYGGTFATNVLTLAVNTAAMDDSDKLLIFYEDPTVLASELMLNNIYSKLSGDPSTETTLSALLALAATEAKQDDIITAIGNLISSGATEATLANVFSAIASHTTILTAIYTNGAGLFTAFGDQNDTVVGSPSAEASFMSLFKTMATLMATAAKQDVGNASLATIAGKDFATQTTLAAVLAKLISAPSTEAKQDIIITALSGILTELGQKVEPADLSGLSSEATVAAILAKIIASPATEAKQDTGNSALADINTVLGVQGSGTALTPTQTAPIISLLKLLGTNIASILTAINSGLPTASEDDASATGDKGLRVLTFIRKATPANTSNNDGDYEYPQMDGGSIWVKLSTAIPAGSAIVGKVGIDQTTPDTTNAVSVIKTPKASSANTPSILTATGDVTGLASNSSRKSWGIHNLGTNTLYVRMGTGATTSVFHFALAPGASNDDGRGASVSDDVYTGVVSVAGTSPRFTVYEL